MGIGAARTRNTAGDKAGGGVRFSVREDGRDILVYHFQTLREACEIHDFIREFFPRAEFVFEPTLH